MPKQEKIDAVNKLHDDIRNSGGFVITDYRGLTVSEMTTLRRNLREFGSSYKVVKNTLFQRAAEGMEGTGMYDMLEGPTAVAFVEKDPVGTAKALVDFARKHKDLEIKGGLVEGHVLGADQIQALSKVPPREVLISQMLGAFQSPIAGFVGTLQGIISEFVFTLQAVADHKAA